MRLGLGPVFVYEWLTTTRRWQLYALRSGFVGIILIGMILLWQNELSRRNPGEFVSIQQMAAYGEQFYVTIATIELSLVLLAAPAATAGAVCLDKARGTLDHVLVTDLSNAEIILGKLGVRLVPVLGLVACVLPITALAGLLGGIDPDALFGSFLTAIACAVLGCALALTLSVWGRKTHEVLMLTYLILILWLLGPILIYLVTYSLGRSWAWSPGLWEWALWSNPYYLDFAPYSNPGKVGLITYLGFLGACLGIAGLLVGLATIRIRSVASRQSGRSTAKSGASRRWFSRTPSRPAWLPELPGPSLDGNPVLWREWHRSRPSRFLRFAWFLYTSLGLLWVVLAYVNMTGAVRGEPEMVGMMNMVQVSVGLLLLSVGAATSLAEERVRGSLDVLLCTPLSSRTILAGKWWGAFRKVLHVVIWPALTAGLLVLQDGRPGHYLLLLGLVLAYGAVITSLGLALATWVSRLGRAIALCVTAYVVFSIGWAVVVAILYEPDPFGLYLAMGSPLFGTVFGTFVTSSSVHMPPSTSAVEIGSAMLVWIIVHSGIAAALFMAALASFDRCLGRVSETSEVPMYYPRAKQAPTIDEESLVI
jgi:ABC-type transport system involved in multi-copper enzyme maturation permease subunit